MVSKETVRHGGRAKARRGVSIIEAVIALMIFAMCIGGFCAIIMQARQLSDQARDHYTAVNMARSRFERARSFEFDQLHLFAEAGVVMNQYSIPDNEGNFERITTVTNLNPRLAQMTVEVRIRDRRTRRFDTDGETLKMYFADYVEPPNSEE